MAHTMTPEKLKQMFARANKTNWSWLLPGIALGLTYFYSDQYQIWFASESLNYKFMCFNLLVPLLALWLLFKRQTEPRVLIWLSIPAIIFHLPAIPSWAGYIYLFNTRFKAVRIAGLLLLSLIALGSTLVFAISVSLYKDVMYANISPHKTLETVQLNDYKVALKENLLFGNYSIEAEKPLGNWFKLVYRLASSRHEDGFYSNLKATGDRIIEADYHLRDSKSAEVETFEYKF